VSLNPPGNTNKGVMYRRIFYLGLILGISRIIISIIVSKTNVNIGYFFDIFIFAYLYLSLLLTKQFFSLKNIFLINILIAIIAILVYDLYLLLSKYPVSLKFFLTKRGVVALNILIISLFSSICYFVTQLLLLKKRR